MKNTVQKGEVLTFTAPSGGVVSGAPTMYDGLMVLPVTTAAVGETYAGSTEGVFELPKENTTAAFAVGETVYWDDTAKVCDETSSGRFGVGTCVADAIATDAVVQVKLKGFSVAAES